MGPVRSLVVPVGPVVDTTCGVRGEKEKGSGREAGERNHGHDRDCIERTMVIVY